jgi:leucyl-tRNA synthetase
VAVNWCPALGTVLANEEVIDGLSERGGHPVVRKPMRQWMLRITKYADRLLDDLDELDWPESIKDMQRNWIGRSEGAEIRFEVAGGVCQPLSVFTTRADTLFGVTYMSVAPEHPDLAALTTPDQKAAVEAYVEASARKSDLERTELQKDKTGVWTGSMAINPLTGEEFQVWVADYVLGSYGSGAVMAVPAHDERDHEFAVKYGLPIKQVVAPAKQGKKEVEVDVQQEAYTGPGSMINSGKYDGQKTAKAKKAIVYDLAQAGQGEIKVNYKLRDWLFARQRYWGEPFPIMFEEGSDVPVLVPEDELPLVLPDTDSFKPTGDGSPPLAAITDWVNVTSPNGKPAMRETNTMPQWAGSCWYYLRFVDPENDQYCIDPELEKYWMPVDLYVGGAEHSVLHLLYARFWHKVLYDCGVVTTKEPFQRLVNQGMILGEVEFTAYQDAEGAFVSAVEDTTGLQAVKLGAEEVEKKGEGYVLKADGSLRVDARAHKMSKSRGNVVNPDDIVTKYGADSLRLYEMFMGPLRETKVWSTRGVEGVHRFLGRSWRLMQASLADQKLLDAPATKEQLKILHTCIQKVTVETEAMRFNTAISAMMEFVNAATKWGSAPRELLEPFVILLAPYAPHVAEEFWALLGHTESLTYEPWPEVKEEYLVEDSVRIAVQVNGKVRGEIMLALDADEAAAMEAAAELENVVKFMDGKQTKKIIYRMGKILNIVVA